MPPSHHGYFSGKGYSYKVYPDYFPLRLSLIAGLQGHRSPSLQAPFRLLEFGCGQGVGLCLQAALHPQAQFYGVDLLPTHISHGRSLAEAASLTNAVFLEADLIEVAQRSVSRPGSASRIPALSAPPADQLSCGPLGLNSFDLAVCHGVLGWVSREVEEAVWQLAASVLRPGGLFCLSYNTLPGKLHEVPFQHLVSSLQRFSSSADACLKSAVAVAERLRIAGAGLFDSQPDLGTLLVDLPRMDPAYLPHEYNQQHWLPRFSDTVIRKAESHGFSFLASARLTDAFDGLLPDAFREIISAEEDMAARQLLRDLLINESFRRDVYVRGRDSVWPQEKVKAIADVQILRLIGDEQLQRSDPKKLFNFPLRYGSIQGDVHWFSAFLMALGSEPRRVGDLLHLEGVGALPSTELLLNLCLLLGKQFLALVAPSVSVDPSIRLNKVLIRKVRSGAPYDSLAAPLIGTAFPISDLDFLALDAHLEGLSGQPLIRSVDEALVSLEQDIQHNGRRLQGGDREDFLKRHIGFFERQTLPLLRRLGALP